MAVVGPGNKSTPTSTVRSRAARKGNKLVVSPAGSFDLARGRLRLLGDTLPSLLPVAHRIQSLPVAIDGMSVARLFSNPYHSAVHRAYTKNYAPKSSSVLRYMHR